MNPYQVVDDFEKALAEYCGSAYAVSTTSCTMALLLACATHHEKVTVDVPKRTYVSVPMSVIHAGHRVRFVDRRWKGQYRLLPLNVTDSARLLTSNMHVFGELTCLSFHWTKTLSAGTGGAILVDDSDTYEWLRRARFDGRTPGVAVQNDSFGHMGYHANMSPRDAAECLTRLAVLPRHNDPLPNDDYPDLSKLECFQ